jgi:Uma2 family endonuclease
MPALATHRFTVEDYYRMAEAGVLRPGARVELLEGEIVDMMPIGPFHSGTTNRLAKFFILLGQDRWDVAIQTPVRLSEHSEPQPDVMLLKPQKHGYLKCHPGPDDVWLLIEVADSSLALDRTQKLPLYGRAGVREVWLLNLPERTVEVHREPHFTGYASVTVLREGEVARPEAFPEVAVDIAALLRQTA